MAKKDNEAVTVMPEILKLRAEFKRKFGNTVIFDEFYTKLKKKIAVETGKAIIEGKDGEER